VNLEFTSVNTSYDFPVRIISKELDNILYEYSLEPLDTNIGTKNNVICLYYNGVLIEDESTVLQKLSTYLGFLYMIKLGCLLLDTYNEEIVKKLKNLLMFSKKKNKIYPKNKYVEDTLISAIDLKTKVIEYKKDIRESGELIKIWPYKLLNDIIDKKLSEFEKLDYSMEEISELINFYENRLTNHKAIFWGFFAGLFASVIILMIERLFNIIN
jgi:hypothetical protein